MFDIVEWTMINQTGTVERQYTKLFNVSSLAMFVNPSDDFASYLICDYLDYRYLRKDVFVTKGKIFIVM